MSEPRLDENALRRPDFRGGAPVTLADGQEWILARPAELFVPDDSEAGFAARWNFGDEYAALVRAADEAGRSGSGNAVIRAELALGRYLLLKNYALDAPQVASLIQFSYDPEGDPVHWQLHEDVLAVAFGRVPSPKPEAGGSASPS